MLKDNEVRRTNFVQHQHEGILKVTAIGAAAFSAVNETDNKFNFNYEDCEPIPITDDLLLKFTKFRIDEDLTRADYTHFFIYRRTGSLWIGRNAESVNDFFFAFGEHDASAVQVKGLHHLQNIVFDLTTKELEVTIWDR